MTSILLSLYLVSVIFSFLVLVIEYLRSSTYRFSPMESIVGLAIVPCIPVLNIVVDTSGTVINWCGMPVAKIGDYVHSGNGVSAGTIGCGAGLRPKSQSDHAVWPSPLVGWRCRNARRYRARRMVVGNDPAHRRSSAGSERLLHSSWET